jgi:hypothetical protein
MRSLQTIAIPRRLMYAFACFSLCASGTRSVRAYSAPEAYVEPSSTGGGGGRWFTGSPADGFNCGVCHLPSPSVREFPLYVAGLPLASGYSPAGKQVVNLSWPEFAARWIEWRHGAAVSSAQNAASPSVGLVAEFVAESGRGSGTIEIDTASATPAELCEMTRPNLRPRLGAQLYQVRVGVDPLLIKPDANGLLRCESRQLGQRCVVALTSCGAQQIRLAWTAPPRWEGPIWFSAGFVATEALSGTPEFDSFKEVSLPIAQAGAASTAYQQVLHSSCTLVAIGPQPSAAAPLSVLTVWLWLAWRRLRRARQPGRMRSRTRADDWRTRVVSLTALLAASGCDIDTTEGTRSSYSNTGLYTPGSTLGASDPTDTPSARAGLGNRCAALPPTPSEKQASPPTSGTLRVDYQTQTMRGRYAPRNCSAVWIETASGQYVATLEIAAALRRAALVYFQDHACTEKQPADVVTSATRKDHTKPHMAMWSGADFEGKPAANGAYKLFIEVTESDKEPGILSAFDFVKGPTAFDIEAPVDVDSPLLHVGLAWKLAPGGGMRDAQDAN